MDAMLSHIMMTSTSSEARLRARNQLTLPEAVVSAAGMVEGDRFIVEVDAGDPDTVRLHRIRPSYAGALRGIYGDTDAYLQSERESWE